MPFNVPAASLRGTRLSVLPTEAGEVPSPTFGERLSAAVQLESGTFAAFQLATRERFRPEPDFNPFDHLRPGEEAIASEFADVNSMRELFERRRELKRRRDLERQLGTGLSSVAAIAIAAIADPVGLIAGGLASRPFALARGALRGAATLGAAGAADLAAQEALLRAAQPTRPIEESLASIALGAAFGGALGSVLGGIAGRTARDAAITDATTLLAQGSTAGAARFEPVDPASLELGSAFGLERVLGSKVFKPFVAPAIRMMQSPYRATREALVRLTDIGVVTKGVLRGIPGPQAAEVLARGRVDALTVGARRALSTAYRAHRSAGGQLSEIEFRRAVGRAMRRGDAHADATIASVAKGLRQTIYNPLSREAQALGLLPEDLRPRTAESYFPRDYLQRELELRGDELERRLARLFEGSGADPTDALDLAREIVRTISGTAAGRLPSIKLPEGQLGRFKERTLLVPDHVLEDFLEDDALVVTDRFVRSVVNDIELSRAFGHVAPEQGLSDILAKLGDEAADAIDRAPTAADKVRLRKRLKEDQTAVELVFQRVRGTVRESRDPRYDGLRRAARVTRNILPTQLLGSVTVSNLPDAGRIIMEEGLTRTFGTIFADLGTGFQGIRMARAEAQQGGAALEWALGQQRTTLLDAAQTRFTEATTLGERIEAGSARINDLFFKATGLTPFTDVLKSASSALATTRILRTAEKVAAGQRLTSFESTRAAAAGLTPEMLRRIASQREHWRKAAGGQIRLAGIEHWTDAEARRAMQAAVLRDVDNAVVTPFAADVPLWVGPEWTRLVFLFKRFSAAVSGRLLLTAMQRRDLAALNGVAALVGMGMGVAALKDIVNRGSIEERDARAWIVNGIDRSGVLASFFELNSLFEFTGAAPLSLLAGKEPSRFAGRTFFERAGGPAVGQIDRATRAINRAIGVLGDSEFTASDLHNLRRLAPFQNVVGLGLVFNEVEAALARRGDLKGRERLPSLLARQE